MRVYTIGFSQKSAKEFFGKLQDVGIKNLIDVRLNNTSQLAGFTKRDDLAFFLKQLCGAEYIHEPLLAPTQEMLDAYRKKQDTWQDYERKFLALMADRKIEEKISKDLFNVPTVLLCSENSAKRCHRRLVLEYLQKKWGGLEIVHL
ncbi:hypothetical protein Desku_3213 [Desulfofundulus kuznetsovii DSM 6115]|uniref:DUF488 domain-containing protein n=1 Tax=Desulfofundulus kuznetsovii (strain DSM 6115 / VKM B-1805 / 17) TaxID=760568 RepID=A0AAU8Q1P6_DESK7|nr:hypothetical protein Desku_3213 [Desulfofundulus kuznetsovii DSM 6115]